MKNILYISSFFPPAGGVGVQRITKFCKYLARSGYKPFVLTPPAWSVRRDSDASMLSDLPTGLEQINPGFVDVRRLIPGEVAKYLRTWERNHFFPDTIIQWAKVVGKLLPRIIMEKQIDVVFITLPHFSLLSLAPLINANSNVPVILDMRDPFSFNFYVKQETDAAYIKRVMELEQSAFAACDAILNVTKGIHEEYVQLYPTLTEKFHFIPNGFDDEDFPALMPDVNKLPNPCLTLCYTGSYSSMASILPYRDAIIDVFLKHGVRIMLKLLTPTAPKRVRRDFKLLAKYGLLDYQGFLTHKEAIDYQLNSHVLLFPALPTEGYFSGKLYEYIRAARPVLCAIDTMKDCHRLIEQAGVGMFVDVRKPDALSNALLSLHQQWQEHSIAVKPNWEFISTFSAANRSKILAELIAGLSL